VGKSRRAEQKGKGGCGGRERLRFKRFKEKVRRIPSKSKDLDILFRSTNLISDLWKKYTWNNDLADTSKRTQQTSSNMKTPSMSIVLLNPLLTVTHALASSSSTSHLSHRHHANLHQRSSNLKASFHRHHVNHHSECGRHHHHHHHHHQSSNTQLNLQLSGVLELIPRGGAVESAATVGLGSKLAALTSTPNGSFNLALGVLAATTAGLKVYGRSIGEGGSDVNGAVSSCVLTVLLYDCGE
jgi:hypothetical protein